jgi:hypothetical protein
MQVMFFGLVYQDKDIVFRFIIEYSSLRDFGPSVIIIGLFLYEDFWKIIFCLVLKLEISYNRVIIISWRIFCLFQRIFFEDYIFAMVKYLNFHNSSLALIYFFLCKWQGHSVTHPLFFKNLWSRWVGNHWQEDLAKFVYQRAK